MLEYVFLSLFLFFDNHNPSNISGPTLTIPLSIISKNCSYSKMWLRISSFSLDKPAMRLELSSSSTIPKYWWKNSVDIYLANKEITKKADIEYYRSRPILKLILDIYFIPTNFIRLLKFLRMLHEYKKNQIEIKVLTYELFHKENRGS